jgi:hypothetical protein
MMVVRYLTSATYNETTNMAMIFPIRFLYLIFHDLIEAVYVAHHLCTT